ncbi:unnamed protein product [Amoebophrya sp. A25]|nr:unnamed protein product [Amoebophrya sp. A25]|eukprot:GSA25T00024177001.1
MTWSSWKRFLLLIPGHGDIDRWPFVKNSIERIQDSFAWSQYFSARDLDCAIYTWRRREEYDLETLIGKATSGRGGSPEAAADPTTFNKANNGTGVHQCAVIRKEGAHYQNALYDAYLKYFALRGNGFTRSSNSLSTGSGAAITPSTATSKSTTTYDFVLVLLDDVAVLRFDPDIIFPVMWENDLSVLQPHSLCSASSRLQPAQYLDQLLHYATPGWTSRTFEMQMTVFTGSGFSCFSEELLWDAGKVKGGFDKLFFWACGGAMTQEIRREVGGREDFYSVHRGARAVKATVTTTGGEDTKTKSETIRHEDILEMVRQVRRRRRGWSLSEPDTLYPSMEARRPSTTSVAGDPEIIDSYQLQLEETSANQDSADGFWQQHHRWASPVNSIPVPQELKIGPRGGSPDAATMNTDYDRQVVYPVGHLWFRAIVLHLVWAVPQGTLYLARDHDVFLTRGEKRRQTKLDKSIRLLNHDEKEKGEENQEKQKMDQKVAEEATQGLSEEELRGFWSFSLIKMQHKYIARKFLQWRVEILKQCAGSSSSRAPGVGDERGASRGMNTTDLMRRRTWLLSDKTCLTEKYRFILHQMLQAGKPLLETAAAGLFAPATVDEVEWVRGIAETRSVEQASPDGTIHEELWAVSLASGERKPADGDQHSFLYSNPTLLLDLALQSLSAYNSRPSNPSRLASSNEFFEMPKLTIPLDAFLHFAIVEKGGAHPWPESGDFARRAHRIASASEVLHPTSRKLFQAAVAFSTALVENFSVSTEFLPMPLRELTKTRFLPRRSYYEELSLNLSGEQKRHLVATLTDQMTSSKSGTGAEDSSQIHRLSAPQQPGLKYTGRLPLEASALVVPEEHSAWKPSSPESNTTDANDADVKEEKATGASSSMLEQVQSVRQQLLRENYYFDRALKFDPYAVAQYNLAKHAVLNRPNTFRKPMAVGESSRLVRGGRTANGKPFTQLVDLQYDFRFLQEKDWLDALNDHSLVNIHICSEANLIAANDPNKHIGINEQGWDRERSSVK